MLFWQAADASMARKTTVKTGTALPIERILVVLEELEVLENVPITTIWRCLHYLSYLSHLSHVSNVRYDYNDPYRVRCNQLVQSCEYSELASVNIVGAVTTVTSMKSVLSV